MIIGCNDTENIIISINGMQFDLLGMHYQLPPDIALTLFKLVADCGYNSFSGLHVLRYIIDNLGDFVVKDC